MSTTRLRRDSSSAQVSLGARMGAFFLFTRQQCGAAWRRQAFNGLAVVIGGEEIAKRLVAHPLGAAFVSSTLVTLTSTQRTSLKPARRSQRSRAGTDGRNHTLRICA